MRFFCAHDLYYSNIGLICDAIYGIGCRSGGSGNGGLRPEGSWLLAKAQLNFAGKRIVICTTMTRVWLFILNFVFLALIPTSVQCQLILYVD